MTYAPRYLKLTLATAIAFSALAAIFLGAGVPRAEASAQASAALNCPTFRVLHNDRIGKINLPAGTYNVTVLDDRRLQCRAASKLFTRFLQDWDGVLPYPWVGRPNGVGKATFRRGSSSATGFRVARTGGGGGGGGGGVRQTCPGTFQVLHNDRIGSFYIPKGQYRITLLNNQRFTCPQAVRKFQEFLLDYDGHLPHPWALNRNTATFYRMDKRAVGFNINRSYTPKPPSPGSRTWARCAGTFRVLNNDRIGALFLPRGPYFISVLRNPTLSCTKASSLFRQFLSIPSGRLPGGWRLNARQAKFTKGPGRLTFRVKQAFAPRGIAGD
jgi:hypothetical protein